MRSLAEVTRSGCQTHQELTGHGIAPAEGLRLVGSEVTRRDTHRPRQHGLDVAGPGDGTLDHGEGIRRRLVVHAERGPPLTLQVAPLDRVRAGVEDHRPIVVHRVPDGRDMGPAVSTNRGQLSGAGGLCEQESAQPFGGHGNAHTVGNFPAARPIPRRQSGGSTLSSANLTRHAQGS